MIEWTKEWTSERGDVEVLALMKDDVRLGAVTIDYRNRRFELGYRPGLLGWKRGLPVYEGRGWKTLLQQDAKTALSKAVDY